jgi:hypothetical protein
MKYIYSVVLILIILTSRLKDIFLEMDKGE